MRQVFLILLTLGLFSCNQQTANNKDLQNRIDSLEVKLANTYRPGFGDFMGTVQTHHAKLWFAGQHENWKLADFEVHELMEAIEAIEEYHPNRKETQLIGMIYPAIDSVDIAIDQKDLEKFKESYTNLTNTCNKCHHATEMEYVEMKIPNLSPYSNQNFDAAK
ncbi:hypothetical protein [Arenibacter certesii]|uniref:Cytochrome C n=1 Tax=Arenibacter certesii TaxID=228955 RepID=A0A918IWR2_9FLAO|nr:hypothetical protein [Arenibacter certesii]GGW35755.1 hypothetical protein GCM10007383_20990 [Arenibacter certesii]